MQFKHDYAAFDYEPLEECDLTEYQLWADRGSKQNYGTVPQRTC
jgi:hypothetical protein